MATTEASKGENPKKTLAQSQASDPNKKSSSDDQMSVPTSAAASFNPEEGQPPLSGGRGETKAVLNTGATSAEDISVNGDDAPVTDIQKKIRRAERFGMPVQLSEEEKRNSRAERFGTGMGTHGSDALKKSEEQKRKARAERFGLAQSTISDEEAKKKARLARFGAGSKTDPAEEDKRKARAIRFSQNQPTNLSEETNGEGQIQTKTALLDKASAGP